MAQTAQTGSAQARIVRFEVLEISVTRAVIARISNGKLESLEFLVYRLNCHEPFKRLSIVRIALDRTNALDCANCFGLRELSISLI